MSRTESVTGVATTSPDGTIPDGDNLSNWGSADEDSAVVLVAAEAAAADRQQRRQNATTSNTFRRTSAPSSSTIRSDARRGNALSSARLGGGIKVGPGPEGAVRLSSKTNGRRSQTPTTTSRAKQATAAPTSRRGGRGGSLERPNAVGSAPRRTARARLSVEKKGTKPRPSSIGSVGKRGSLDSGRAGDDQEEEDEALRNIGDLDAAAPSQEEIRLMIDRIRRESAVEEVVAGGRVASSKEPTFELEVAPASGSSVTSKLLRYARGVTRQQPLALSLQPPLSNGSLVSSSSAAAAAAAARHRRRASASSNDGAAAGAGGVEGGAAVGVIGMSEIEEEERRLQEKANKLESEMSAVKSRRLEVHLVKVEQQLQEEAAMRLVQREARINLEVERSCRALAAEREQRVAGVAAAKENLRGKLEQLSSMYEEVSRRMDNLERAYAQAESELKARALADQRKAVEREDRGVRRRIRAIMLEHGEKKRIESSHDATAAAAGNGDALSCGEPSRGRSEERSDERAGSEEPWFFAQEDAADHQQHLAQSPSAAAQGGEQQLFEQQTLEHQKLKKLELLQNLQRQRALGAERSAATAGHQQRQQLKTKSGTDRRRSAGSVGSVGSIGAVGVGAAPSSVGTAAARQRRRRASVEPAF